MLPDNIRCVENMKSLKKNLKSRRVVIAPYAIAIFLLLFIFHIVGPTA